MRTPKYLADFSLALINRTGAYYVSRDVVEHLGAFFPTVRYWRLFQRSEPRGLLRKVLARAMLFEFTRLASLTSWPRARGNGGLATLYFDPLYVLRARLDRQDIVLCHDVGPISHTDLFDAATTTMYQRAYAAIRQAKPGMVFVSEASRSDFVSLYGDDFRFMTVIPLYVRTPLSGGEKTPPPGVSKPFLLTVGALEIRKNHKRIIEAFVSSGLRERGFSYVFCGPRGNSAADVQAIARTTPGVHGFGYLSDAEVRWLYDHAEGFVLPSLLEGFGLPPLEAAKRGLIAIVSGEGAQREAVGDGAIIVDAKSVASIADGMRQLANMPLLEKERRLKLVRLHADGLTQERYLKSWSDLLSAN